jgi:hypothetical protein
MASERLSQLRHRILAWLWAEAQRMRGTMAASHQNLVRTLAHDKGNLSTSLRAWRPRVRSGSIGRREGKRSP